MDHSLCVATVLGISISEPNTTIELMEGIFISNDWSNFPHVLSLVDCDPFQFQVLVGTTTEIDKTGVYGYGIFSPQISPDNALGLINVALEAFWFIDNIPVFAPAGYLIYNGISAFNVNRNVFRSDCSGNYSTYETNQILINSVQKYLELRGMSILYKMYNKPKNRETLSVVNKSPVNEVEYNSFTRIQRAFKFLEIVRANSFVPYKIAFYIGCLECLFAVNETEISHKVAERIAFYLEKSNDQRKKIFETIKTGYDVRSKYFHGDVMPKSAKTAEGASELSRKLDTITRRIFLTILSSDDNVDLFNNDNQYKVFLKDIIFRG